MANIWKKQKMYSSTHLKFLNINPNFDVDTSDTNGGKKVFITLIPIPLPSGGINGDESALSH